MDSQQLVQLGVLIFGSLSVFILIFTVTSLSKEKEVEKRYSKAIESRNLRAPRNEATERGAGRKQAVADTLSSIDNEKRKNKRVKLYVRLKRAGVNMSVQTFYTLSLTLGVVCASYAYIVVPTFSPVIFFCIFIVAAFGIPSWILAFLFKRRQAKFVDELTNAIDIIVRGVKSGLSINECIAIVARESAQPLASEFNEIVESHRVGMPIPECFERLCTRMPLAEVRFFSIVISIQQSSGGSLSEALGNLANVLRSRKQLTAKVGALSAEAKASAAVLASLPLIVMTLVNFTNPDYLVPLWTTFLGKFMLGAAAVWMLIGCVIMRKMINFKY
ncbi:MAG TPA: hypothetical protein TECP_00444 [Hyphomicrobiaceae bacterium MAG_BT-2024]